MRACVRSHFWSLLSLQSLPCLQSLPAMRDPRPKLIVQAVAASTAAIWVSGLFTGFHAWRHEIGIDLVINALSRGGWVGFKKYYYNFFNYLFAHLPPRVFGHKTAQAVQAVQAVPAVHAVQAVRSR